MPRTIHCPWCSKDISVNASGRLTPHIHGAANRCCGSGALAKQVEAMNRNIKKVHSR